MSALKKDAFVNGTFDFYKRNTVHLQMKFRREIKMEPT